MKKLNILFLSILLVGLCTMSCGSKDSSSGCDEVEMDQKQMILNDAQTTLTDAQITYEVNKTEANCLAYTEAWDNYLAQLYIFIQCLDGPARPLWESNFATQQALRSDFSC